MAGITIFSSEKLLFHKLRIINHIEKYNFLFEVSANIIIERLKAFTKSFYNIADYNNGETFLLANYLKTSTNLSEYYSLVIDLRLNKEATSAINNEILELKSNHLDLFTANLNLHWINDLPGFFIQIFRALQKDGVFIGTCFGRNTLKELRHSIYLTQEELGLPFTNHISPFIDCENGVLLLKRAGFVFQVADFEEIIVNYSNIKELFYDLRNMGETNIMPYPTNPFSKKFLYHLERNYRKNFFDENQSLIATFQIIILTASKI